MASFSVPMGDFNKMSKEEEADVDAHFTRLADIGVGKPALINPVPATIANKLPQLGAEHKNYNDAVKAYKELAHSGRFAVNFPTYATKKNGNRVFSGLESYSLGQWHPKLKKTVDIKDALHNAKILNKMKKYSNAYGVNKPNAIIKEKYHGTLQDYANQNQETHDVAKKLQDAVKGLPSSRLVGRQRLGKKRIRQITTPDGVQHDTTTEHPRHTRKVIGIDGRPKDLPSRGGGRKTRKHRRKRKTRKRKTRKRKTRKRKTRKRKTRKYKKTTRHGRKRRTSKKQLGRGNMFSGALIPFGDSVQPRQPHLDHTLADANIAKHQRGFKVSQYPSCNGNQCDAWSEGVPRPTGSYSDLEKPTARNPKKRTRRERKAWKEYKLRKQMSTIQGDLIARLTE